MMSDKDKIKLYKKVIARWGISSQEDVCVEEMAELSQAILRLRRKALQPYVNGSMDAVEEEIADVEIMLEQIKLYYNLQSAVDVWKSYKLNRLKERVGKR